MDRESLRQAIVTSGCTVTRWVDDGWPTEFDCDDAWAKVRILDALAWTDARYDPVVRRLAVAIVGSAPDTTPARLAARIHAAVKARVRYLGEGIETFQPSRQTWRLGLGDCDDTARLVAALARSIGLRAEVLGLAGGDGDPVHAVARVEGLWCDASLAAHPGEHPLRARQRLLAAGRPLYNYRPGMGDAAGDAASRVQGRAALSAAWDSLGGLPAKTTAALQMAQAVARVEGGYAEGCWPHCPEVCHNAGGLQLPGSPVTHDGSIPVCPPGSAPCVDTHPNADGSNTSFGVCFMTYPTQAAGLAAFLQRLIVTHETADVIGSGDADAMSRAMYASHYFGGYGATDEERIAGYADGIASWAQQIASSLGEPNLIARGPLGAGATLGHPHVLGAAALALLAVVGYRRGWHRAIAGAVQRHI
jgi:hypothetical protein